MKEEKRKIPFHKPFFDEKEQKAAVRAIKCGMIGFGPMVKAFEKEFAAYIGASHAIAVNSCSSALHLSVLAAGIGVGDEVITTPFTFCSTALAILYTGATPVFADIKEDTYGISPQSIREKITNKTKAVIVVHYAGVPCDMKEIIEICKEYKLALIEDAAHALPAGYEGRLIGQDLPEVLNLVCFSFQATKTLSIGDGGMITTWNKEAAEKIRKLRLFGMKRHDNSGKEIDIALQYGVEMMGYKYNMTDVEAAIGRIQLKKLEEMVLLRSNVARRYTMGLDTVEGIHLQRLEEGAHSSNHLYVIRLEDTNKRDALRIYLADQGIVTSIHFIPMYRFAYFRPGYGDVFDGASNVEKVADSIISLPIYPSMTEEEVDYVINHIKTFFMEGDAAL